MKIALNAAFVAAAICTAFVVAAIAVHRGVRACLRNGWALLTRLLSEPSSCTPSSHTARDVLATFPRQRRPEALPLYGPTSAVEHFVVEKFTADAVLLGETPSGDQVVTATLRYDSRDSYAVTVTATNAHSARRVWTFALDLFADALVVGKSGEGSIRMRVTPAERLMVAHIDQATTTSVSLSLPVPVVRDLLRAITGTPFRTEVYVESAVDTLIATTQRS